MGASAIDMVGKTFGRLTVLSQAADTASRRPRKQWHCKCSCGNDCISRGEDLRVGKIVSCGCRRSETKIELGGIVTVHGKSKTPEYLNWKGLRRRCLSKNNPNYPRYGGRGIKVCERWNSFENFYADMGKRPTPMHSIDRIDNDGNYEPSNCRWATRAEQNRNARSNVAAIIDGERVLMADAARRLGVPASFIAYRLAKGWPIERAFTEPKNVKS